MNLRGLEVRFSWECTRLSLRLLLRRNITKSLVLVRGGLTLLSRNLALFTPSEMWWWCGSKVTIRGMFLSVVSVDLVVIRSSLRNAAALVWASKSSFMGKPLWCMLAIMLSVCLK